MYFPLGHLLHLSTKVLPVAFSRNHKVGLRVLCALPVPRLYHCCAGVSRTIKIRHDNANTVCGHTDLLVSNTKQWHGSKFYICGHTLFMIQSQFTKRGSNLLIVKVLGCSSNSKQCLTSLKRRFIINLRLHGYQLR